MDNVFVQLAIILGIASLLGFVAIRLKLPLIIAYLLGGLLIATTSLFDVHTSKALSFLPDIGIAFVLFLVGMELDLRELKNIGKTVLVSGLIQIIITTIVGSTVARVFGFGAAESWYMGAGLAFSSTVLIIKLLIDKKDQTALYAKLTIGITLLEDLVAVMILLALTLSPSTFHFGIPSFLVIAVFVLKVIVLFVLAIILNRLVLEIIFKAVSKQSELLFLTALAWCFIYSSFAIFLGFTVTIGAFIAGVVLASSPYHYQIQGKIKPLRDFFVTLFFVYLGTKVNFADLGLTYPVVIIFTLYALVCKPIIYLLLLGAFGYRKHTMFKTSLCLTQISEFSLIIILVGFNNHIATQSALTTIALSSTLSMIISTLMIVQSPRIYSILQSFVSFFERKNYKAGDYLEAMTLKNHIVAIGGHRVGGEMVKFFKKEKIPYVVLDFNPLHIGQLLKEGINAIYGDVADPEVMDAVNLAEAKMVISTVQDLEDNLLLIEELKSRKINVPIIVRAATTTEAEALYKAGADLVLIPAVITGDLLTEIMKDHLNDKDYFRERARIEQDKLERKTLAWE